MASAWHARSTGCTGPPAAANRLAGVRGPDLPHTVDGLPDEAEGAPLARLLGHVRGCGPARIELRLPVPGDPDGLPPEVLAPALEAGEAVVLQPDDLTRPGLVLV